jgi:acyl dehydratase
MMTYLRQTEGDFQFTRLESDFTKPVFVGDCLILRIWEDVSQDKAAMRRRMLLFKVLNADMNEAVIDHGIAVIGRTAKDSDVQSRARL